MLGFDERVNLGLIFTISGIKFHPFSWDQTSILERSNLKNDDKHY